MQKAKALAPNDITIYNTIVSMTTDYNSISHQRSQGCVFTWGLYDSKALGHDDTKDKHTPVMVEALRGNHIIDISCGAMHTVAVAGTGETYSWGDNRYGQVGASAIGASDVSPTHYEYRVPVLIPALIGVHISAVSCGTGHTVVVAIDGRVYSWGLGAHGQLGHDTTEHMQVPTRIEALAACNVVAVACGIAHSVFLIEGDGSIRGCGMNDYGALGIDTKGESVLLPRIISLPWRENHMNSQNCSVAVAHLACGGAHTVVITTLGDMYSCGSNSCGQLGLDCSDSTSDFCTLTHVQTFDDGCEWKGDVRKRGEAGGGKVRCAYVACGEEFTIMITDDRQVYATGLGIAGQMGNGTTKSNTHFTCISALNGKNIEEVSCAQGAVFGIAEGGEVYTWGLPGDRHRETSLIQSSESLCLTPTIAGVFAKRKRARQISCGRKHYALLTIAPYGGTSYVVGATGPSSTVQDPCEIDLFRAGRRKLKCKIQSCDIKGEAIDYGGYVLRAILLPIEDADDSFSGSKWDQIDRNLIEFHIDDNLDGTYSCESVERLKRAGKFQLDISLDRIALMHSPFLVQVLPGEVFPAECRVRARGVLLADEDSNNCESMRLQSITCERGQIILLDITCLDQYGNLVVDPTYEMGIVHAELYEAQGSVRKHYSCEDLPAVWCTEKSTLCIELRSPSRIGTYEVLLSFGEHGSKQLIGGATLTLKCIGPSKCDPQQCTLHVPTVISVDRCPLIIEVDIKESNSDPLCVEGDIGVPIVSSVVSPLHSEGLSARALIRLYTWQQNPYGPVPGKLTWNSARLSAGKADGMQMNDMQSVAVLSHNIKVAGEAHVEVIIGNNERIYTSSVMILPGAPSPEFTELINAKVALREWDADEEFRYVEFQCRDQYGNVCDTGCELVAEMWEEDREDHKVKLESSHYSDGSKPAVMLIKIKRLSSRHVAHVFGVSMICDGERLELQYSPFTLGKEFSYEEAPSTPAPETLKKEHTSPIKRKATAQEMTNRRAFEALREKRRALVREKEDRIRNKSARRTGGGFVIQYSKDI